MRCLSYALAINEALHQMLNADPSVMVIGQGINSPWYVGNTARGLLERFGPNRVIDTPVSENGITGAAVGAALAGMRPVVVHPRMDFMLYAMDPIINQASNWSYMNGGRLSVPIVFWGIINRGGEQAAQHSQAFYSMFANVPGLKVVAPSTAYDAKGLMISAILDPDPVVFVDDRWLYNESGEAPEELYEVKIGQAVIRKEGKDVTLVSSSWPSQQCMEASTIVEHHGISVEVVDLVSIKPMDTELIFESVKKTGRLIVVDGGWRTCGLTAEISATVSENCFDYLKAPVTRMTLPDCPAPASRTLEHNYYFSPQKISDAVMKLVSS